MNISFDGFNFTRRTHCPSCETRLVLIDNKIEFCPLCEILKRKKAVESEKEYNITQKIF